MGKVGRKAFLPITVSKAENPKEYQRQYDALKRRDYEKRREADWKRRYGISREDYEEMLSKQDGRCAICKTDEMPKGMNHFVVDHCHKTGKVRGLLCDRCNRGLGYFKDNPPFLDSAIHYLVNS